MPDEKPMPDMFYSMPPADRRRALNAPMPDENEMMAFIEHLQRERMQLLSACVASLPAGDPMFERAARLMGLEQTMFELLRKVVSTGQE